MKKIGLLFVVVILVATACGPKGLVTVGGNEGAQGGIGGPGAEADTGIAAGPGTGGDVDGGAGTGDVPGGGAGNGGTGGGSEILDSTGLFPYETEGVTKDRITVCAHVPITGAAPVPRHWKRFGQFYFDHVNANGGVHGRKVTLQVYDDQYYPAGARDAMERCKRKGAFIYAGAAGTDQIVSVAKWAESLKVPYFHGPTSIKDLEGFKYNVHTGPSYEFQHELLADYLVNKYTKNAVYGMLRLNSPFFTAGHDAFVKRLKAHGVTLKVDRVVQKDETNFTAVLLELEREGVQVVNNFTNPNVWIKMLKQKPATYDPTWTAVSPGAGFNLVAQALGEGNAVVFHHFNPACECATFKEEEMSQHRDLEWYPEIQKFLQIFRKYSPEQDNPPVDDIDFSAYLSAKATHDLLVALGPNPTRSGLWKLLETYKEKPAETFPRCAADYTRGHARMGAWRVNVFELKTGTWSQLESCIDRA